MHARMREHLIFHITRAICERFRRVPSEIAGWNG